MQGGESVGGVADHGTVRQAIGFQPGDVVLEPRKLAQNVVAILGGIMGHEARDLERCDREDGAGVGLAIRGLQLNAIAAHAVGVEAKMDGQRTRLVPGPP